MNPKFKDVSKFGRRLGLTVVVTNELPDSNTAKFLGCHYENHTIYIKRDDKRKIFNLIHEYGHFLSSTKRKRTKVNYGLKSGRFFPSERDRRRENEACKYELALMKVLGFSAKIINWRANYLNCLDYVRKIPTYVRKIKKVI